MLTEKNMKITPILKSVIAEFFFTVFLDQNPLKRVSSLKNNCFEYERIEKLDTVECPLYWINSEVDRQSFSFMDFSFIKSVHELANSIIKQAFVSLPYFLSNPVRPWPHSIPKTLRTYCRINPSKRLQRGLLAPAD